MHAVFVTSRIGDYEKARQELHDRVLPNIKQAPGFVAGYWLAPVDGGKGHSVVVFESEETARTAAERLDPPAEVTIEKVEVREVAGHA